jgi:hypothetical protein
LVNLEERVSDLIEEIKDLKKTNEILVKEIKASDYNEAEDLAFVAVSIV